jgi:lysozyme
MKITKTSKKGVDLIKKHEGFRSKPYLCPANVPTIGYGATFYPDGRKVKLTDESINETIGEVILKKHLEKFEQYVDSYCTDKLNQNQFDALVSFCFNLGPSNLKASTLLKKVNANHNDPTIKDEFMKWVKAGGRTLKGLVTRRTEEANLYFS